MTPPGLLQEYCFTSRNEDQLDVVAICLSGLRTAHASGPHARIHPETGRETYTSPVVPKGIHLDDTVIFLLAFFVSFGFSVLQEHCFTSGYTSGKSPIPLTQIIYFISLV